MWAKWWSPCSRRNTLWFGYQMTRTNSTDNLINCYKCSCRQQKSELVNLEAERDEKSAIKLCTPVLSVWRECFLYISIFIAVHSRSFRAQSNIKPKLICWQLFHVLNISISNRTHRHNEILFKVKSISKLFYSISQPQIQNFHQHCWSINHHHQSLCI